MNLITSRSAVRICVRRSQQSCSSSGVPYAGFKTGLYAKLYVPQASWESHGQKSCRTLDAWHCVDTKWSINCCWTGCPETTLAPNQGWNVLTLGHPISTQLDLTATLAILAACTQRGCSAHGTSALATGFTARLTIPHPLAQTERKLWKCRAQNRLQHQPYWICCMYRAYDNGQPHPLGGLVVLCEAKCAVDGPPKGQ